MKRRDVVRTIAAAARTQDLDFIIVREGANHTVYSLDGLMIPVPRHRELDDRLARVIFGECEPKLGKGWWR